MATAGDSDLGRKVFFLYPPPVLREHLIEVIARYEYEVYVIEDHQRCPMLLTQYAGAILFVNIDSTLKEPVWEQFIRRMISHPPAEDVRIGVLAAQSSEELARRYLIDIGVQCGFVALKVEIEQSAKILLRTLEPAEAKGKRKHVRASAGDTASFNVQGATTAAGRVLDISAAGMACQFDGAVSYKVGHKFTDLQLILRGARTSTRAHVIAVRQGQSKGEDALPTYVMIFDHRAHGQRSIARIQSVVSHPLQQRMDEEMARLRRAYPDA